MKRQIADEASPAAFERDLRVLRFKDRHLERAFQQDYALRRLPQWRVVFWIGIAIQLPVSLRFYFVQHLGLDDPRFWIRLALGIGLAVVGLRLAASSAAVRWLPRYIVWYVLVLGGFITVLFAPNPTGWTFLTTYLTAACIMSRLSARESVAVVLLLIGWFTYLTVVVYDRPAAALVAAMLGLGVLSVFIAAANYMIENSARRDFLLQRLLGQEREMSERLLLNVLPEPIAEQLKESPGTIAESFDEITVLFADIADSTPNIARMEPRAAVELLNDIFTSFDRLAVKHGLEKIKTIGDAYMVVGGLPEPRPDHAETVVAMALDMQEEIAKFTWPSGEPLVMRVGINTGPAVAGVIGTSKFTYDLWGDTVNVASRMESHGIVGGIQLTQTTHRRVRRSHRCTQRTVNVKGKGPMPVYVLQSSGAGAKKRKVRRKSAAVAKR